MTGTTIIIHPEMSASSISIIQSLFWVSHALSKLHVNTTRLESLRLCLSGHAKYLIPQTEFET